MGMLLTRGLAAAGLLVSIQASAQSLEQSYAAQCATAAQRKTEMCRVMAQALVAKLQGASSEDAPRTSGPARKPAASMLSPAELRGRWGFVVDVIGQPMFAMNAETGVADTAMRYVLDWEVPGSVLLRKQLGADGAVQGFSTYRWNEDEQRVERTLASINTLQTFTVEPNGNLTAVIQASTGVVREHWEVLATSYRIWSEINEGHGWTPHNDIVFSPPTPEALAHAGELAAFHNKLYKNRQQTAAVKAAMQGSRSDEEFDQYIAELKRKNAEREAEKQRRARERSDRFGQIMGAAYAGLTAANDVASAHEAESRARLDATLAEARAQSQAAPAPTTPSAASAARVVTTAPRDVASQGASAVTSRSPAAAAPLRFVLSIGLMNKPGDTVNPTCYSNVITRPGPPGWGASGFLPQGSAEKAREEVDALKSRFIALCRNSGREITSEGDFHWTWNELRDGDRQIAETHARYREDVSVEL